MRIWRCLPILFVVMGVLNGPSHAEVPLVINFQGMLSEAGVPVDLPDAAIGIRIYADGAPIWEETHSNVPVSSGIYSILIGNGTGASEQLSLKDALGASGVLEMEVLVDGTPTGPRQPITSVPYSFRAGTAGDADRLGGQIPADFMPINEDKWVNENGDSMTGPLSVAGEIQSSVGGFRFPDGTVQATAARGDGSSLDAADGTPQDAVTVDNAGNVGIGTVAPNARLDVLGTLKLTPGLFYYASISSVSGHVNPRCACDISSTSRECTNSYYTDTDAGSPCYDWSETGLPGDKQPISHVYNRTASTPAAVSVSTNGILNVTDQLFVGRTLNIGVGTASGALNAFTNTGGPAIHGQSTGGVGVNGYAPSSGTGVSGSSVNGIGVYGQTGAGTAGYFKATGDGYGLIVETGNVGIGTTTPSSMLDVAGDAAISGNVSLSGQIIQEPWQFPTLLNGWVDYGGSYLTARYFKDSMGMVHLAGLVKDGTINTVIFTLPAGYRPEGTELFATSSTGAENSGKIEIRADGGVLPVYGNNGYISLSGISFRAQ